MVLSGAAGFPSVRKGVPPIIGRGFPSASFNDIYYSCSGTTAIVHGVIVYTMEDAPLDELEAARPVCTGT